MTVQDATTYGRHTTTVTCRAEFDLRCRTRCRRVRTRVQASPVVEASTTDHRVTRVDDASWLSLTLQSISVKHQESLTTHQPATVSCLFVLTIYCRLHCISQNCRSQQYVLLPYCIVSYHISAQYSSSSQTFYFGLVKMSVMMELVITVSLQ